MSTRPFNLALCTLVLCGTTSAQDLLLDVETTLSSAKPTPNPREFAVVDGIAYFSAEASPDPSARELWRTDGTEAGTWLVKDIAQPGSSLPADITDFGDGTFFFTAQTDATGRELWRSDGTEGGTALVADIFPGVGSSDPASLVVFDGEVFFFADGDDDFGTELWSSDGTAGGTALVANFVAGAGGFEGRLFATSTHLFVVTRSPGDPQEFALYSSTGAGLIELFRGGSSLILDVLDFVPFGDDLLYFRGGDNPWVTDGTVAGTYPICDCEFAQRAHAAGNRVFFTASTPATGFELWSTDGTEAGTAMVGEVNAGPTDSTIGVTMVARGDGEVFFDAGANSFATSLYVATPTTITPFGSIPSGNLELRDPVGRDGLTVQRSNQLWATPSLASDLAVIADLTSPSVEHYTGSIPYAGGQLLGAGIESGGAALVFTDGTPGGTGIVADVAPHPTNGSNPSAFTTIGDATYFFATTDATGRELWVTDGTAAGTQLVADVNPGPASAVGNSTELVAVGDRVVFVADAMPALAPYASDGTAAGTVALAPASPDVLATDIAAFDGRAFFFHADATNGRQLWSSDGTPAGTAMLVDISPGVNGISGGELTVVGDRLFLTPIVGGVGREPWVTDGTAAGTFLLEDIRPGSASSDPADFAPFGERVVFSADTAAAGREVWVTDGVVGSTSLALDVVPGPADSDANGFVAKDGVLAFVARKVAPVGTSAIFTTDETFSTLTNVYDTGGGPPTAEIFAFDSGIGFLDAGGDAKGIWQTDGTVAGTTQIVDDSVVWPLDFLGEPGTDGAVLFSAFAPPYTSFDRQLWITDGTAAGTSLVVADPATATTLAPSAFERLGTSLVYASESSLYGREPFVLPLLATGAHVAEVIGGGCAGTGGVVPSVTTNGAAADGELFTVGLAGAAPNAPSYLAASTGVATLEPCALVPAAPLLLLLATDGSGEITVPFVPDSSFVGLRIVLQWATLDPEGSFVNKASLSPALEIVFGP